MRQLNGKTDGKPIWPELPTDVLQANPAFLDDNAEKTKGWYWPAEAEQDCRSLFLVQKRTVHVPFLKIFDLPENTTSCGRRDVSTVAPQALRIAQLTVGAQVSKSSRGARRSRTNTKEFGVVRTAFGLMLQRDPSSREAGRAQAFLQQQTLAELCRVLLNLNEFLYIE